MDTTITRNRLSDQIEEAILSSIQSGKYLPGSKLPSERTLMSMFDVGRPSVREALLALERKGFVRLKRGVAPVVLEPTPKGAMEAISDMVQAMLNDPSHRSDFYDLRIILETVAAMEAARTCDAEDIETLDEALEACRKNVGRAGRFRDADQAFHRCLMALQQNSVANALHGALIEWGLYYPEKGPDIEKIHARAISEHEVIMDAIRTRDPNAAAAALRDHLMRRRNTGNK